MKISKVDSHFPFGAKIYAKNHGQKKIKNQIATLTLNY